MSVTDGLTTGAEGEQDVNSLQGFEAAMVGKGVEPEEGDSTSNDTSIASGLTEAPATEQTRDPASGQFVPKQDTPVVTPEADTAPEDQGTDPAVEAFLAKYNGDAGAALKAAVEAQSVIGRQGQELGQTREQLAELKGRLDALQSMQSAAPAAPTLTAEQAEAKAIELSSTVGYHEAATTLVNEFLESGDSKAYDALLSNWVLEDPIAAQRYDLQFQLWRDKQNAPVAAPDPVLQTIKEQQGVNDIAATLGALAAERGDSWALIAPHMDAAIEQVHPSVAALVASADAEERLAGARIVADRATVLASTSPAAPMAPAKTPAQIAAEAAVARKTAGSQVATGSLRPASADTATPEQKSEAVKAFKEELLGTSDTSVARGLTYGN